MRIALVTVACLLATAAACVDTDDAPLPDDPPEQPPGVIYGIPGREHQGRKLLGHGIDALAGVTTSQLWSASPTGATSSTFTVSGSVTVGATGLSVNDSTGAARTGAALIGLTLATSDGSQLRIDSVTSAGGITYYQMMRKVTTVWRPLCQDSGMTVAVAGTFADDGTWTGGSRISLPCADGVAHKCVNWGQGPGSGQFEPCTRMARADYCHNGRTHTFDGTTIQIYDQLATTPAPVPPYTSIPVAPPPPVPVGTFWFEAGWHRDDGVVMCLSKLRWQALPIGGPCPTILPDPRDGETTGGVYCEQFALPDQITAMEHAGAALFVESEFNDIGFYVWQNGSRYYSTVLGDTTASPMTPPAAGYSGARFQGTLWTAPDTGRISLDTYVNGSGKLVTTTATALPPGFTSAHHEGYLESTSSPFTAPLYRYFNPATLEYTTLADAPPLGFGSPVLLGYLLQP